MKPDDTRGAAEPPAQTGHTVDSLAWTVALNALALPLGFLYLPLNRHVEDDPVARDHPVPFGPESAWLALDTTDTAAVARALGLRNARPASWADGVAAAGRSAVFVTPPLGEWTLAVSTRLIPPSRTAEFVTILLERMGQQFADAQYFCTSAGMGLHVWARCRGGRLVRGYAAGQWNVGPPTEEERELGLSDEAGGGGRAADQELTDEERVLLLASFWSIDPSTLDEHFKEPVMGLLGTAAWE